MTIWNSLIVPENLTGGTLWDFQTSIMFQNIEKIEGGPFGTIKKFSKKSHSSGNKSKLKTPR